MSKQAEWIDAVRALTKTALRPLVDEDAWAEAALVLPARPSVLAERFAEVLKGCWVT